MLAAVLMAVGTSTASGQSAIYGAGLQAWLGCWSAELSTVRTDAAPTIVCITPTPNVDVADVLTVQGGRIVARETLDATGRPRPIDASHCTGERSARWSNDRRRLFVHSVGNCAGVSSSTSGLLAMSADGDWIDVEAVSAGGGASVRVARYKEVAPPAVLPIAVRSALRAQALATRSVRAAASAPVRAEDVLEASRLLDAAVVDAWILERAQRFDITATDLAALVNLGVPTRVTDALGAIADTESYTLARGVDDASSGTHASTDSEWSDMPFGLGWGWGYGYGFPVGLRYGGGYRNARRFGYYRPPIGIVRGHEGRPRGRGESGHGGYAHGHGRDGRDGAHQGTATSRPPVGDPRHAPPARPPGGTVRLGKPRG
ncbi:MAG: hypothetical protein ACJ79A_07050 [Gemmatimonadaceae bacterium]